jgi:hypothetical protein
MAANREALGRAGKKGGAVTAAKRRNGYHPLPKFQGRPKPPPPLKLTKGRCTDCKAKFTAMGKDAVRKLLLAHWEEHHRGEKHVYRLPTLEEALGTEPEPSEPELVPLEPEGDGDAA